MEMNKKTYRRKREDEEMNKRHRVVQEEMRMNKRI